MYLKMCKKRLGDLNCNTVWVYCTYNMIYLFVVEFIHCVWFCWVGQGGGEGRTVHFKNLQKSFFPFREVRHNLSGSFQQFWQFLPSFSVSAEQKPHGDSHNNIQYNIYFSTSVKRQNRLYENIYYNIYPSIYPFPSDFNELKKKKHMIWPLEQLLIV